MATEKVVIISDSDKNKKTVYDCKGKTGVCIPTTEYDFENNAFKSARAVGSTMYITIHMCVGVVNNTEKWEDVELTFKNYTSIKNVYFLNTAKQNPVFPTDYSTDPSYYAFIINHLPEIKNTDKAGSTVVTGTEFDDKIDMSEFTTGAVTIKARDGSDIITGTTKADNITGGTGENIINYSKGDGNDIVNLTAKEKLTIKMSDGENEYTIDNLSFEYANKNKDLIINTGKEGEFITLKNFAAKDVTGTEGSVHLEIGGKTYDLKTSQDITDPENITSVPLYVTTIDGKGSNFTGTWLADVIDAHEVEGRTIRKKIDGEWDNEYDSPTNKGLTLKGGGGDDIITTTKYSDTVTGGAGENTINHTGGNDTIVLTKGEQLTIYASSIDDLRKSKNGKDLVLCIDEDDDGYTDSVVLKNYLKSDGTGANGYVRMTTDGVEFTYLNEASDVFKYDEDNVKVNAKKRTATLSGTRLGDTIEIDASSVEYNDDYDGSVLKYTISGGEGNNDITFSGGINSNTITAGKGSDKISIDTEYYYHPEDEDFKGFKNATTTVKAGAGENDITVSGTGHNLLVTGKDNDTFHITGETTTTIKAGGGENTINVESSAFGQVTLADEKVKGTINNIVFDDSVVLTSATKNKNDLVLATADSESSFTVSNYFSQTGKNSVKNLNGVKLEDLNDFLGDLHLNVTGAGTVKGTEFNDNITTTDSAEGYSGKAKNDTVTGGKGNDIINAGKGNNNICYSIGDGDDTILSGGGVDTLVFDAGTEVSAIKSGADLIVTYKNATTANDITVKDYYNGSKPAGHSVQFVKIGKAQAVKISEYIQDGELQITHILGTDENREVELEAGETGNNLIVFDNEPYIGRNTTLISTGERGENDTDTIKFTKLSFVEKTVEIMVETINEGYTDNLWIDATVPANVGGEGDILYKDFYSTTATNIPKVVIQDKDNVYSVNKYVEPTADITLTGNGSAISVIKDTEGTNKLTSNTGNNVINTFGGAELDYTYAGGHDSVNSLDYTKAINDTYRASMANSTNLIISDNSGDDTLVVSGVSDVTNLRLIFDVVRNGDDYVCSTHSVLLKGDPTKALLETAVQAKGAFVSNGINIFGTIETINVTDTSQKNTVINSATWSNSILDNVAAWFEALPEGEGDEYDFTSVADALKKCTDATLINQLLACYTAYEVPNGEYEVNDTHKYPDSEEPLVLTAGLDNTVTFSGQYDECYITSQNTSPNKDTLQISDVKMTDFYVLDEMTNGSGQLYLDTYWHGEGETEGGGAIYYSYSTLNTPGIVVEDTAHAYNYHGYTSDCDESLNDGSNNMILINNVDGDPSSIDSTNGYNVIKSVGSLLYSNYGGTDTVFSAANTDDSYSIYLTADTSIKIYDFGKGTNKDTVGINANPDDVRFVFNGAVNNSQYVEGSGMDHFVALDSTVLSGMSAADFKNIFNSNTGANIMSLNNYIDSVDISGDEVTFDDNETSGLNIEGHYVQEAVAGWLSAHSEYDSVADALDALDAVDDAGAITSLKNCFLTGSYTPEA